jgi:hypothetical protein
MIKWVIRIGSAAGALAAIMTLWVALGFPTLATGSDIKRLDRGQADIAVETYNAKLRGLLVIAPPAGTPAHDAWEEDLKNAREQIKRAEDRKIELGK